MLHVVVHIENLAQKSSIQHVFRGSPVHIGRNKLNELALADGFVSLWHGILRFDENSLEYLDLDSTNGTELDGQRLRRNIFVPVTDKTDLRIGSLRFHFSRREAVAAEPESSPTLFGQRTVQFALQQSGSASPAPQLASTAIFKSAAGRAPGSPAILRAPEEQSPAAVAGSLFLLYENYRQAWRALHTNLTNKVAQLPAEKRAATLQLLQQRFPALEQEEQFRAVRESAGVSTSAPPVGKSSVAAKAESTETP